MTSDGKAFGVLVTLSAIGSNGVTTLDHALTYARQFWQWVDLATAPLDFPGLAPVIFG